jgi:hypothetical protein
MVAQRNANYVATGNPCSIGFLRVPRTDHEDTNFGPYVFKSVLQHLYDKITDDAAEWVAKIFWYMLSLLIWYAMGHINLLL